MSGATALQQQAALSRRGLAYWSDAPGGGVWALTDTGRVVLVDRDGTVRPDAGNAVRAAAADPAADWVYTAGAYLWGFEWPIPAHDPMPARLRERDDWQQFRSLLYPIHPDGACRRWLSLDGKAGVRHADRFERRVGV